MRKSLVTLRFQATLDFVHHRVSCNIRISCSIGFHATMDFMQLFVRYRQIADIQESHWIEAKDAYWALAKPKDPLIVFTGNNKIFEKRVKSDMAKFKPALKVDGSET